MPLKEAVRCWIDVVVSCGRRVRFSLNLARMRFRLRAGFWRDQTCLYRSVCGDVLQSCVYACAPGVADARRDRND